MRYATNLLKHEIICIEIHQMETTPMFRFPISGSFEMGLIEAVWIKVDTLPDSRRDNDRNFIKQKQIYNEHLVGNEIFRAIDAGIEFLLKEKESYNV